MSSILTDTYKRELERYGAEMIEDVESFFGASSNFVLESLRRDASFPDGRLMAAFQSSDLILTSLIELPEQKIAVQYE